jgi:hypothetical protein
MMAFRESTVWAVRNAFIAIIRYWPFAFVASIARMLAIVEWTFSLAISICCLLCFPSVCFSPDQDGQGTTQLNHCHESRVHKEASRVSVIMQSALAGVVWLKWCTGERPRRCRRKTKVRADVGSRGTIVAAT